MSNYETLNINGRHFELAKYNTQANDLANKIETAYHRMRYHLKQHENQRINKDVFFYRGNNNDEHKKYQECKHEYEKCISTIEEIHRAQILIALLKGRFTAKREYVHITNEERCLINRNMQYLTQDNVTFCKSLEFKHNSNGIDIITVTMQEEEA